MVMGNTNFQTIYPMGGIVNGMVKQATGREPVDNLDMDYVTVAQNTVVGELEFTGDVVQFETGRSVPIRKLLVNIEPVQSGSGDPSPENVRPISGWTGVNVSRTGKNLLPKMRRYVANGLSPVVNDDGSITITGTATGTGGQITDWCVLPIPIVSGVTYTLGFGTTLPERIRAFFETDKGTQRTIDIFAGSNNITFTNSPWNGDTGLKVRFYFSTNAGTTYNFTIYPMIEIGEYSTDYEPYTGETITTTFPTSPGTVYGGTLDVITGVLTVDMVSVDIGSLSYTRTSSGGVDIFRNNLGAKSVSDNLQHGLTSIYPFAGTRFIGSMPNKSWMIDSNGRFSIRDDSYTNVTDFATAMNGQTLVYELATPQTYQLTPQEVSTLVGDNTIYSDAGTVDVMYWVYREMS